MTTESAGNQSPRPALLMKLFSIEYDKYVLKVYHIV